MAAPPPAFFEVVCEALAPRCGGEVRTVRALGSPFGDGTFERWVGAGLLSTEEAASLLALAAAGTVDKSRIEAVLGSEEITRPDDGFGWGFEGRDDKTAADAQVRRAVPSSRRPLPPKDEESDSWGWGADESSAIFESLISEHVTALEPGVRFRLDAPHARTRVSDIVHTRDLLMGRNAAAHVLRPDAPLGRAAFIRGVRLLGSLQHPQIEPVYELDRTKDDVPFYVTAEPLEATLAQVFKQIAQDDKAARDEWPLVARLEVLLDVARAIAFAHRAGVTHRDLRPSKVRLGAFGETLLTGWFRARRRADEPDQTFDAAMALVNGGLGYLAPERLENGLSAAGAAADVWGLGSLLYGCLTRRPPFAGSSREVSKAIREGRIVPPEERGAGVPPALSTLCMQALEIDPARRRISADEFVAEVEDYLDGTRTEERRLEQAEERLEDAEQVAQRFYGARGRLGTGWDRAAALRGGADAEGEDPLAMRLAVDGLRIDAEKAFYAADDAYVRALSVMPSFDPARYGLCRLYFRALQDAQTGRLRLPPHVLRANIRQLDPGGFTDALAASARLEIRTRPSNVEVRFHQYRSRGGVQTPDRGRVVGTTPLAFEEVRPGDYVMVLAAGDGRSYVLPVHLAPGEAVSLSIRLPGELPAGCAFVPSSPTRVGIDGAGGDLANALPGGRVELESFAITRDPVTFGEYQTFLNDRWQADPAQAAEHAPRAFDGLPPIWTPGPEGYQLPFTGTDGRQWTARHPAVGLRPQDVQAYIAWRSAQDGVKWRLPTELEWEKTARSAEGRAYPWGDRAEPTFCHHMAGDGRAPVLEPVGSVEADRSVYGVRDLAGGVREYVGELDAPTLRGGSWLLPFSESLLAVRGALSPTAPLTALGFRLALDGPDGPQKVDPPIVPEGDWQMPEPLRVGGGLSAEDGLASAEITVAGRSILMNAAVPKVPEPEEAADLDDLDTGPDRYTLMDEIARGSMGKVMLAYDRVLKRHVALKLLHDKHRSDKLSRYRFVMEARITGRLQHPTMVPVYDMGVLRTGQRFFSMKVIEGQSLQDVLRARSAGDRRTLTDYNRDRLLTVMRRVCQGVAFAHERRIVHRDLKPANILLGDFGEVCVVDLGLARCLEPDPSDMADVEEARELAQADGRVTRVGSVIGTPYYMSPEQAMGLQDLVDDRSDIYGLGAILYHVLAHRPPFSGRKVNEVLAKVRRGNPRPPSLAAPDQGIAPALDEIVLRTLSMDPSDRYESALDLADAMALYQARARMEEKSREAARQRAARALRTFQAVEQEQGRLDQMRARVHALRTDDVTDRDPTERRRRVVHQQEKIRLQEEQIEAHLALAVRQMRLALDAGPVAVRERLVTLLKTRCLRAERTRDPGAAGFYVHLLQQLDEDGGLRRWLERGAPLSVHSRPSDIAVVVQQAVPRLRRLEPGPTLHQGHSPLTLPDVPVGSGLCTFTRSRVSMRVPFAVVRDRPVEVEVEWPNRVHPGFACIPGGRFLYGGDPLIDEGHAARSARIGTYHIGIHPVTCGEYNEWLEALADTPDQRAARIPIMGRDGLPMWSPEGQAVFGRYDPKRPVTGITLADAHAYAQWRSKRDGVRYRLPTSAEWEKAARGVDGRPWPWGDVFEPAWCRPEAPGIFQVGRFAQDASPYGVQDIVTGVVEWTLTAARDDPNACYVRGGCSALPLHGQPCTARTTRDPRAPSPYIGFRLVIAPR